MILTYALFLLPLVLFVAAFLYETFLSFRRLANPKGGKSNYVNATWEVTHTLLIFSVVVLLMMFTPYIEQIAGAIFTSTLIAGVALCVRAAAYTQIFYGRKKQLINWVDWVFALSHVVAALFLVITVIKSLWFLYQNNPTPNQQFLPAFIPGLVLVLAICIVPIVMLYRTKN